MKKISMMFFALLAAVIMSANEFTKVTSAPTDWSGQYLLTYTSGDSVCIFNGNDANNAYVRVNKPTDGKITSNDLDGYVVELASMTGGYSVKWVASGKYMYGDAKKNIINFGTEQALNTVMFGNADSVELVSNTSKFVFNSNKTNGLRFRYFKATTATATASQYKRLTLYKAKNEIKPEAWTPDTISVSEARALIAKSDPKMNKSHYVYGVVCSTEFGQNWPGWAMIWMTDIDNPADSLEGYKIYKDANSTTWASASEIPCGLGDTIMLFADGLALYKDKMIYETTSGYFVEVLGKATTVDANSIYNYAVGAVAGGYIEASKKYSYELILSRTSVESTEDAMHFKIKSSDSLGIAGKYSIYADESYDDELGAAAGSLEITYLSNDGGVLNHYNVKANYKIGDVTYTLDKEFDIAGWYSDFSEQFQLKNDIPFVPDEGDTITCAQATSYAKTLGSEKSSLNVWVKGYAVGFRSVTGRTQQSIKMSDTKGGSNEFEAYYCYTQNLDSIVVGDEILVKGNILYYAPVGEIKYGNIYRIGGSDTKRPRTLSYENVPAGAITVDSALAIGNKLVAEVKQTVSTDVEYTVYGYIVDVNRQTSQDSATWYMSDTQGAYGDFKAYKCGITNLIDEDDMVFVTGKISKFQKSADEVSIEIAKGNAKFTQKFPTGIVEQAAAAEPAKGAKKVMMNGQMFIMKDGVLYNALGAQVQK